MTVKAAIDAYLTDLFSGIRLANGYRTDAGADVFLELEYTEKPEVIPCLCLYRGELSSGTAGPVPPCCNEDNHLYPWAIEGFIADTKDGAAGQLLEADIIRRLGSDPSLGGLIESQEDIKSVTAVEQGDDVYSTVKVSFTAFYVTPRGEL